MKRRIRTSIIIAITLAVFVTSFTFNSSAATSYYQYRAVKVRNLSKELGSTAFASTQGQPGITISISSGKTIGRSYSYTAGLNVKAIDTALGWSTSKNESVSISHGGSWKVPAKANNKNVKYGVLKGYLYYDRVEYKIQRRLVTSSPAGRGGTRVRFGNWVDCKTKCIAKKARVNDVVYKKSYIYK